MNFNWLLDVSDDYVDRFKDIATHIVMHEVRGTDSDDEETLIMYTAKDMAMGAMLKRGEHVMTGIGIGIIGTALAFAVGNKVISLKGEKEIDVDIAYDELSVTNEDVMERVNDILKKDDNLEDLKSIIEELRANEK